MNSRLITLRTPVDLMQRIDLVARRRQMTRSALIEQVLREFLTGIRKRGHLIPPYDGDDILLHLRLNRRRQHLGGYGFRQ